ncbi:MAG: Exodeoxyribonuclease 7 small subunit [Legionellaceae bacterium]
MKKVKEFDFEASLAELSTLVEQMEQGGLTLEESLKSFEKGINLVRNCQTALQKAEQKVQVLMEKNGKTEFITYQNDSEG